MATQLSRYLFLLLLSTISLSACLGTNGQTTNRTVQFAVGASSAPLATQIQTADPDTASPESDTLALHLTADGHGDFADLETALIDAPPGASILLGPGSFALERSMTLSDFADLDRRGA